MEEGKFDALCVCLIYYIVERKFNDGALLGPEMDTGSTLQKAQKCQFA